jgi:hypothetical protein
VAARGGTKGGSEGVRQGGDEDEVAGTGWGEKEGRISQSPALYMRKIEGH